MYQPTSTSNYYNNFSLSPEVSRKNTYEMSTRYSAINPISQSQFLDEEQVETIITTTTTVNQPNPAKRLHSQSYYCTSDADLVNQLQRANQSICQLTNDLKGFNESIRKRTGLDIDTRKSQYSMYDNSISPISNNNLNADFTFPSPNPRTARSYTSHVNFTQEIPTTVSQNLNAPLRSSQYIQQLNKSSNNLRESTLKESNPLRISTYHDGTKTVVNFPFTTYTDKDEEVVDTRANYRSTTQIPTQQEDENSSRRYYIKHEDLEYEEFESFVDPSQNYKRIKYPYQHNWQRVYEAPEFIQNLINAQKNRSEVIEQEQSSPVILNQQQQQAVKYSSYIPKASINLFDDSNCRSYAETNNTLSGSYIASANNIPYSQYY